MREVASATLWGAVVVVIVFCIVQLITGCGGGPPPEAQTALSVASRGVVAADAALAPRYTAAAGVCLDGSGTSREYAECIAPWDTAHDALTTSAHALRLAQLGRDAWENGGDEGGFLSATACLVAAAGELVAALLDLGVPVPEELTRALAVVTPYAGGQCQ